MKRGALYSLILTALFVAMICVCSWIQIPFAIPFTLQTFAIYLALLTLGGARGLLSVILYIAIGAVGLPVFSGFTGGAGALLQPSGGFIIGFIFMALIYLLGEKLLPSKPIFKLVLLIVGTLFCYSFGILFFVAFHTDGAFSTSFPSALSVCVLPFIIPDAIKLTAAFFISKRIRRLSENSLN